MRKFFRNVVYLAFLVIGAARVYRGTRRRRQVPIRQPRILLVHPGHMGAIVMVTPVIHALRQHAPDAHITMLIGPWSTEVVSRHPDVDEILTCTFPSLRDNSYNPLKSYQLLFKVAKQIRQGNYDLAISLRPRFWWAAALIYIAAVPYRVGYAVKPCTPYFTHTVPRVGLEHFTTTYLRLASVGLRVLGYDSFSEPYQPEDYPMYFKPTEEEKQWAIDRINAERKTAAQPVVIIHPGSGGAVKLWRAEAWATCADTLVNSPGVFSNACILLTGSKGEVPILKKVAGSMTSAASIITGMTLGQLAALLQQAQVVLGVDSGPLHLAVAQGTPTLRIYGPTNARIFGPWGTPAKHTVIASTQRCASCPAIPCNRLNFRQDEIATHPCVQKVSEQEVLSSISTMFSALSSSNPDINNTTFTDIKTYSNTNEYSRSDLFC